MLNLNSYTEIERIWEAYKELLVPRDRERIEALTQQENRQKKMIKQAAGQSPYFNGCISFRNLLAKGKMYLSSDEIEAMCEGKLNIYL